jgi:hypothetical protein
MASSSYQKTRAICSLYITFAYNFIIDCTVKLDKRDRTFYFIKNYLANY